MSGAPVLAWGQADLRWPAVTAGICVAGGAAWLRRQRRLATADLALPQRVAAVERGRRWHLAPTLAAGGFYAAAALPGARRPPCSAARSCC